MKKVIIMFLVAGFFAGCHSGKKKSSKNYKHRSTYTAKTQNTSKTTEAASAGTGNVNHINSAEPEENTANQSMTRLDSILGNTGTSTYYGTDRTNFQGASGAGTGSSYASGMYAASKAKKKAKKKRVYNEDELNPDFIQTGNNYNTTPADTATSIGADSVNTASEMGW